MWSDGERIESVHAIATTDPNAALLGSSWVLDETSERRRTYVGGWRCSLPQRLMLRALSRRAMMGRLPQRLPWRVSKIGRVLVPALSATSRSVWLASLQPAVPQH